MVAVGLVLPCVVTGGAAPCDAPACHHGAIQYLPSVCCRDSTGTFSFCLAFSLRLTIKERKERQEIIQRVGSVSPFATLPPIAVQSLT